MGLSITTRGSWDRTVQHLKRLQANSAFALLDRYGQAGVAALASATPVESNLTASSWTYDIVKKNTYYAIHWRNTNVEDGIPIAVILQYGHATRTGGYVQGRDYIMPAIQPIFDQMITDFWKEVTK